MAKETKETTTLITKLLSIQSQEIGVTKDKKGVYGKYMSLDNILDSYKKPLSDEGLVIYHQINTEGVLTTLTDGSENIQSVFPLTPSENPQKVGSQITYAKRYNICALLNIASEEDDDGELAKTTEKKSEKKHFGKEKIPLFKENASKLGLKTFEQAKAEIERLYTVDKDTLSELEARYDTKVCL